MAENIEVTNAVDTTSGLQVTPHADVKTSTTTLSNAHSMNVKQADSNKASNKVSTPQLSQYLDYRKFLMDFYNFQRQQFRSYNYATFAAGADIKSPNYLKLIIDGKRNLSDEMVVKFARALRLNKAELIELQALVRFNQTDDPNERTTFLNELTAMRVQHKIDSGEITEAAWEKVPNWIAWVIYEMADQQGVDFAPEKLRELLKRKVRVEDVKRAVDMLYATGELCRDEVSGRVKKVQDQNKIEEIPVELVKKLQEEFIHLALESLYQDSPKEREISAATITLTEKEFEQLRFDLRQLRKRYQKDVAVARAQAAGERVYQLNLQLFALTEKAQS